MRVEDEDGAQVSTQLVDIDTSQTMAQMRKLLSNVAGRPASKLLMFHVAPGCQDVRITNSDRRVHSLRMRDGDVVVLMYKIQRQT